MTNGNGSFGRGILSTKYTEMDRVLGYSYLNDYSN